MFMVGHLQLRDLQHEMTRFDEAKDVPGQHGKLREKPDVVLDTRETKHLAGLAGALTVTLTNLLDKI
jgi:hypothetical protein